MQVVDWKELKEGDKFRLPKTDKNAEYYLGLTYPADTIYLKKGQHFALLGRPDYLFGNGTPTATNAKIPVEVVDDINDKLVQLMGLSARVGTFTGTDPEIFVTRKGKVTGKEHILPAFKFLVTQAEAAKVAPQPTGGMYSKLNYAYRDGFAAEYFVQANRCHAYLLDDIRGGLIKILTAAKKVDSTAALTLQNSFRITKTILNAAKDEEIALGCSPSKNVYDDNPELPADARSFQWRFTGGHIHYDVQDKKKIPDIIKACDIFAAIPAVAIFREFDTPMRRQFYGRAGEYRTPKYGFEYRVLSNAWLGHPAITHLFFNLVRIATKIGFNGLTDALGMTTDEAREIINYCDVKRAQEFTMKHVDVYMSLLRNDGAGAADSKGKVAFQKIVSEGVEALLPEYRNIEKNWAFGANWMEHSNDSTAYWGRAGEYVKAA